MTPTSLLLIRHGETAWNAEHRIQGQLDIPLSVTGMRQSAQLAERLASEPIAAIYSSDLTRAELTAAPLGTRIGRIPKLDRRLRERDFGVFQGLTLDEIAHRFPREFARWRARELGWAVPDGESAQQLLERVTAALTDIIALHPGATVVIVAHGGVLDALYRRARDLAWDAPRQHQMLNASINRLHAEGPPLALRLVDWGDVSHLVQARDESLT